MAWEAFLGGKTPQPVPQTVRTPQPEKPPEICVDTSMRMDNFSLSFSGKKFDTEICETTLYNWIYRGNIFMNVTEEDLLYKGDRREPEDRKRQKRARAAKGDTIEQCPEEVNSRDKFGNWEMDSVMGCKGSKEALAEEWLANYPCRILGWKTPQMLYDEYMTVVA